MGELTGFQASKLRAMPLDFYTQSRLREYVSAPPRPRYPKHLTSRRIWPFDRQLEVLTSHGWGIVQKEDLMQLGTSMVFK